MGPGAFRFNVGITTAEVNIVFKISTVRRVTARPFSVVNQDCLLYVVKRCPGPQRSTLLSPAPISPEHLCGFFDMHHCSHLILEAFKRVVFSSKKASGVDGLFTPQPTFL